MNKTSIMPIGNLNIFNSTEQWNKSDYETNLKVNKYKDLHTDNE